MSRSLLGTFIQDNLGFEAGTAWNPLTVRIPHAAQQRLVKPAAHVLLGMTLAMSLEESSTTEQRHDIMRVLGWTDTVLPHERPAAAHPVVEIHPAAKEATYAFTAPTIACQRRVRRAALCQERPKGG